MLPNFIIIGAAKAGTTSLYQYLRQHPQVFMSPLKETNFYACAGVRPAFQGPGDDRWFNRRAVIDPAVYEANFAQAGDARAIGEASPYYLYHPNAAGNIHRAIPHARIIAIFRNPIDRAFSSFLHLRRDGREPETTFPAALALEDHRIAQHWEFIWHYLGASRYAEQAQRYVDLFPREQLGFYLYDDFDADPVGFTRHVFEFLGVDASFVPDTTVRHNVSGVPTRPLIYQLAASARFNLLRRIGLAILPPKQRLRLLDYIVRHSRQPAVLSPDVHAELAEHFREDVGRLGELLGRDLSFWLRPKAAAAPSAGRAAKAAAKSSPQLKAT